MYNQDSNVLLRHAIQTFEGKEPPPLKSRSEKKQKELPPMPIPGEVDFIFGGMYSGIIWNVLLKIMQALHVKVSQG